MSQAKLYGLVIGLVVVLAGFCLISAWMSSLSTPWFSDHWGPQTEKVTLNNVSVANTNPLILNVNMTSLHYYDIEFNYGYIQDKNHNVVAQCLSEVPYGFSTDGRGHWSQHYVVCVVPANSKAQVSLNFNTTLPSGNYCLELGYWSYSNLYSDYFTLP